ncbi:hypothetical protein [uncultured Anaerococcus sp.]|uniref:hypothetical protein n=1 Tax=uncultured Anaerococcus sp. TaxID=293428 RepID=UPI0026335D93|nr:hypothetical protein [uncultured Anaerococcus sp.]
MIELKQILKRYNAHLLAYPEIHNAEMKRNEFISGNGNVFYSDLKTGLTPISFTIEYKGNKECIRKHRNELSKILELNSISFDGRVFYEGRFLEKSVETMYFFEKVEYEGKAIAKLYTQSYDLALNENNFIENLGNFKTPVRLILKGNGSNILIKGFNSDIKINNLNGNLTIDAEKGISDSQGLNNIDLIEFPYINDVLNISITGQGDFTCRLEFEGRIIC